MSSSSYFRQRVSDLKRFFQFIKERFDPLSHFVMLALFLLAHLLLANRLNLWTIPLHSTLLLFLGVCVFFFKLRLYDEIKDYDTDLKINPHRPLPRGLVSVPEVKRGIECCLVLEWLLFAQCGWAGLLGIAMASGYSLLMYHEFFIGDLIRPHLTTYATSHTVVTLILSMAIFMGLSETLPWQLPYELFLFALVSWLLFNIFELGRKTYLKSEEKDQVESYSKVWTRPGAIILVLSHGALASVLIGKISFFANTALIQYLWGIVLLLALSGLGVVLQSKGSMGKLYRGLSSFYIILVYLGIIVKLI